MKVLRLFTILSALPLLWTGASAQELSPTQPPFITREIPNEWERVPSMPAPLAKSSAAAPLVLRGGATPTGLQGFYDYQSNGQSPTWIRVNPFDPDEIHVVYMLAESGASVDQVGSTRRVGYSKSTDGGQTWSATLDISGVDLRLGFPFIQLSDIGNGLRPLVATHGDGGSGGVQTLFYADLDGSLTRVYDMNRLAPSNRAGEDGAGIIWPAFVTHADNPLHQEVIGSLSFRTGEAPAPLQVATADFNEPTAAPWRNIHPDSISTATSGGRYIIARAPSGKLGVAYHHFLDFGDVTLGAIRLTESTDNGATWSEPEIIMADEEDQSRETNENGNIDTLGPGSSLDFTYLGEDPHIVFQATINNLFKYQSIYHWSGSTGEVVRIATTDIDSARGIINHPRLLFQPGGVMGLGYPSIAVGDDGEHVVVAYMAQAQIDTDEDPLNEVLQLISSPEGFGYQRIWMVGSKDGGQTWGANHVLQDWADAEGETDSASIEYPSLNDIARVEDGEGEVTIDMAFQARRSAGMYAFIVEDLDGNGTDDDPATRGPIQETFQYHQRTALSPDMFNSSLGIDDEGPSRSKQAEIKCHPNPAASSVSVLFSTPETGIASLKIYDAVGREVKTVINSERLYGASHLREIDLNSLVPGAYRIVLTQGDVTTSHPLNVVR